MEPVLRFGPFVLDPRERQLTVAGEPVKLTGKSLDTLLQLVRNPGRLISRRELLDTVWPDAVVEEGNLHWTVSAVRKALAVYDPGVPYIETARGFGYRFVQPVHADPRPGAPASAGEAPPPGAVEAPPAPPPGVPGPGAGGPARRRPAARRMLVAGLVLLAALMAAHGRRAGGPPGRRTLAVVGFRNLSARPEDAWLATALAELLAAELCGGPELRAVPGDDIARLRRELALPESEPLAGDALARIARGAGADWVVSGTYVVLPGDERRLRLDARLDDARNGDVIASASRVAREAELFELVGAVGDELRAGADLRAPSSPGGAHGALPAAPAARRAYAEGLERLRRFDARGAVPLFEQAAAAAPDFAGIPLALSRALVVLGDEARAEHEALRAHQLAAGLPEGERLAIEANAHATARRWDAAITAWRRLSRLEPDVHEHALALAETQILAGEFQASLGTLEELRPRLPAGREQARFEWLVATAYGQMDDHALALVHARRAAQIARGQGAREIETRALLREAFALPRAGGSVDDGIRTAQEARRLALASGDKNLLGKCLNFLGTLYSDAEDSAAAESLYRESLALHRELGAHGAIDSVLFNLAVEATTRCDLRGAQSWFEQELEECRTTRSSACAARALTGLGDTRLFRGDLADARRLLEDGLARYRSLGNRNRQAEALASLAEIELWSGRIERAEALFGEALALRETAGGPAARAWARLDSARLRLARGGAAGVKAVVERIAAEAHDGGRSERALEGYARALLARVLLAEGDQRGAEDQSAQAARLVPLPRHPATAFFVASTRARVLLARGERAGALAVVDAQQQAAQSAGLPAYELDARLLRAQLLATAGRADEARARLQEPQVEARAKGFGWIARQAMEAETAPLAAARAGGRQRARPGAGPPPS